MSPNRFPRRRPPTIEGRSLRRAAAGLVVLLVAAGLLPPGTFPASVAPCVAAEEPAPDPARLEEDVLRSELLAGTSDGEWRGVLETRILTREPSMIGRVLGPLFADRTRYLDHAACVAWTAAYLADHPVNGKREVLLGGSILERASRDEEFVAALRKHMTAVQGIRPGWDRLVEQARRSLAAGSASDEESRRAALWLLGREPTEAVLWFLHERGRAGLGVEGGISDESNPIVVEWLDALGGVLSYRFPSAAAAMTFLDGMEGARREDVLAALLRRGTPEADRDRTNAVAWARRLVAAAQAPEQLEEFLDAGRTPYLDVRREAMRRAAQITPRADEPWARLLCVVLDRETDGDVMHGALRVLERVPFREVPALAAALSRCVSARLRRPPESIPTTERASLARILGRLGDAAAVLEGLQWARGASRGVETEVLAELIRATGQVDGISADVALQFYRTHPGDDARDRQVRLAVADALGLPGAAAGPSEAAGSALRALLSGEGAPQLARETAPEVRAMAIQRLQNHPGAPTSALLLKLAEGEDEAEAKAALLVLGVHVLTEPSAAAALADVATKAGSEERRRTAIRDLSGVKPDAPAEVRTQAAAAVRAVLASADAPATLRQDALAAAAALMDVEALDAAIEYQVERPDDQDRRAGLKALLESVATAGAANDLALDSALATLASRGALDLAVDLARALAEAHVRPGLAIARARTLHTRSRAEGRDPADRRKDLEEAGAILEAPGTNSAEGKEAAALLHVRILEDLGALLPKPEDRAETLLRAVERAAAASTRGLAEEGTRLAGSLEQDPKATPLTDAQKQRLKAARETIDRVLKGPPG